MSDNEFKCVGCGELFNQDDVDTFHSELTNETYCYGCYESDLEHASQLILIHGDNDKVKFGDYFAMDDNCEVPDWFKELFDKWEGRNYKKTDGWRGHYETLDKFKNIKKIASGWTTGWADETTRRKAVFNGWAEDLAEGIIPTPYPIYFLAEPTSNIFSMGMDVFCKEKDYDNVISWLDEIGTPQSVLQEQLS